MTQLSTQASSTQIHSNDYPLVLLGHGTRDQAGRQAFLKFAQHLQYYDPSRPIIPCFLELTDPLLQAGLDQCVDRGFHEVTVLPVLLFAARHSKFDITHALDQARQRHPDLTIHYGRHLGVALQWLTLWQQRLHQIQSSIAPAETVILFVGRGSSDPDANGDVYKLARLLWEGSQYKGIEVCFTGITHPRLEAGFERVWTWNPKRVVVIPHLLFTGVLVKRIQTVVQAQLATHPQIPIQLLSEIGSDPVLFDLIREREAEARQGQVMMNCDLCKFRQAFSHLGHHHTHESDHTHGEQPHHHYHGITDLYPQPENYHHRAWQVP